MHLFCKGDEGGEGEGGRDNWSAWEFMLIAQSAIDCQCPHCHCPPTPRSLFPSLLLALPMPRSLPANCWAFHLAPEPLFKIWPQIFSSIDIHALALLFVPQWRFSHLFYFGRGRGDKSLPTFWGAGTTGSSQCCSWPCTCAGLCRLVQASACLCVHVRACLCLHNSSH